MSDVYSVRRARLEELIAASGGIKALAERADVSEAYVSQIRTQQPDSRTRRPRQMGNALARKLEQAYDKPAGWMDRGASPMSADAEMIARLFDRLPPSRRAELAPLIVAAIGTHVDDDEVERRMPITARPKVGS